MDKRIEVARHLQGKTRWVPFLEGIRNDGRSFLYDAIETLRFSCKYGKIIR